MFDKGMAMSLLVNSSCFLVPSFILCGPDRKMQSKEIKVGQEIEDQAIIIHLTESHCKKRLGIYRIRPNYRIVCLGFSKLLGKLVVKFVSTYTKGTPKKKISKRLI